MDSAILFFVHCHLSSLSPTKTLAAVFEKGDISVEGSHPVPKNPRKLLHLAQQVWFTQHYRDRPTKPNKIVIKVTRDCNLRCTYCYVSGGARKERIAPAMVIDFFDQIADGNPRIIDCTFHGGEPLMVGNIIREVVDGLEKRPYAPRLQFSLQTNATLVTETWVRYFREHRISVSVSLDGPKAINDSTRVNLVGRGSFERTMRGIDLLCKAGGVGLICVVTKQNQDHLIDVLNLCHEKGIRSLSFLPFFPSGYGVGKEDQLGADNLEYWERTKQVIDWLIDHNTRYPDAMIYEREIASIVRNILIPGNGCYMCASSPCGAGTRHVGLDVNGDVYVCDTFYGLTNFVIGNMLTQSIDEILQNPLVERFQQRSVKTIPKCSACHLNEWCYGGCPAHNVLFYGEEEGFNRESHMCSWFMQIIPFLKGRFDKQLIDPNLLSDLPSSSPIVLPASV